MSYTKSVGPVATGQILRSTILRLPEVLRDRARSRTSHYADIQQGLFPAPIKIGRRAVGWPAAEVEILNAARIAGRTEEQIRQLVTQIQAGRASGAPSVTFRNGGDSPTAAASPPRASGGRATCVQRAQGSKRLGQKGGLS
jgi:prophage regulatory protein